ncbi:MAG TPA: ABC transporter permease [Thermoplasmata archaeon]|nr:ABC transporter permease [Thermoplasmata archaeon]
MGRSPSDLAVFVAKRIAQLVPVLFGAVTITFIFARLSISNPCVAWEGSKATKTSLQACTHYFGLNLPLYVQYGRYWQGLLSGNWGIDPNTGLAVLPSLLQAFPETLELVLAALLLMVVIGIPLGVIAANSNGRWADHLVRVFYLSGWSTPTYLAAALLAIGVGSSVGLGSGAFSTFPPPFSEPTHVSVLDAALSGNPLNIGDALGHLILPAIALAFLNMGIVTRLTRSAMLESLPMDFVKTARMKGLSEFWVLYKHALRQSLISTTTVLGLTAGYLLGATVVVEEIFQWPGIGQYAFTAVQTYNFPGTIGVVIFLAVAVVVANLVADILYGVLDPRVEWR